MTPRQKVKVGVIGAGLMGKELAGVLGRWSALQNSSVEPLLTAVCDVNAPALDWFRRAADGGRSTSSTSRCLITCTSACTWTSPRPVSTFSVRSRSVSTPERAQPSAME